MNIVVDLALPLVAGICLFACLTHMLIWLYRRSEHVHTTFAILALVATLCILNQRSIYAASTVQAWNAAYWRTSVLLAFFFPSFTWFVTCYCRIQARRILRGVIALFVALLLLGSYQPAGWFYTSVGDIGARLLPWGERVAFAVDPKSGLLYYVFTLSCWAVYAFALHLCYRRWRLGERIESLLLASGVVLFLGGSVVDTLRELGLVSLYISEFCFVAFVVAMSAGLSRRLRRDAEEQERLNSKLQEEIANHQAAEAAAREGERNFTDAALDAQKDTFFVFEPKAGKMIRWNRALSDLSGYADEEISKMKVPDDWCDGEDLAKAIAATDTVLSQGVATAEISLVTKAGQRIPTEFRASVLCDPQKQTSYIIAVGRDIADRQQAQEELQNGFSEIQHLKERVEAENEYLRKEISMAHLHGDVAAHSSAMKAVMAQAEQVAPTDSTVLILGETGTGKELMARAIHRMSTRHERPLVVVNCAAIPATLIESELFGRKKGACKGALAEQMGHFEVADGSTVFLDEIGALPSEVQAKLLRVLQEGQIQRLGSTKTISVDVRVIAATNRDLQREVDEGRFRQDLFDRLNVSPISIPALRNRREDIPPVVWTFVGEFSEKMGKKVREISRGDMDRLQQYAWPGNIRELRNTIERAVILTSGAKLQVPALGAAPERGAKPQALADVEREHILSVLGQTGWRVRGKGGTAEILGLKPSTLEGRMKRLEIVRPKS